MLGNSPVDAILRHADVSLAAVEKVPELFGDLETQRRAHDEIIVLENQADDIKLEVRSEARKKLFMAVPRQDLVDLVIVQDKLPNRARDIARLAGSRRMQIPEQIREPFDRFVTCNIDAARQAHKSVHELGDLFEAGFRGAEADLVGAMVDDLDKLEAESDRLGWAVTNALFEIEDTLQPVKVMFLYRIIALIAQIGDYADRTGRRLETLLTS